MMMNGMGGMHQGMNMSMNGMNQGMNMGMNGMNQGMNMGMNGMNQGMNMGMNGMQGVDAYNQMGNMTMNGHAGIANMASMPGMMPGSGFESILSNFASIAITLLFWVLLIGGTVFLARGLWELFKPKNPVEAAQVVVTK
ncbi:hypothetical protein [Sporomusa acidovorans]|uniref:hypothetical protein n=1 Tax=Sporomusa acidovorans TaxID=112900 RepID=UPI00088E79D0|nr:hypothetical protein [Sporomusa acidovorans]OZC18979.1 hypothetical protein SPACI_30650 [Sporomusa acidovorans DSM 3132]SDD71894.1 hypothetical protein SAMN04488499_1003153 [Sporomusa acidovorans]